MYKKIRDFFWCFLKIVAVVEVIFGIVWIVNNITGFYEDSIAYNYITASKTLVIDDYMGVGYALLVRIFGHGPVLYLFQLIALLVAFYPFGPMDKEKKVNWIFTDLLIVFNPIVLQAAFAVLPNALILAETVGLVRAILRYDIRIEDLNVKYEALRIIEVFVLETGLGLLNKDYAFIMFFLSLPLIVLLLVKRRKSASLILALTFLSCFLCANINTTRTDVYRYGNVEKSFNYLTLQRYTYGHISESAGLIEDYYGRNLYNEMTAGDKVPERIGRSFGRTLEKIAGKEDTENVYKYISDIAKAKGVGYYGKAIVRDAVYYMLAPFVTVYIYLTGKTESLIANTLFNFTKNAPIVSKAYLIFSEISLCVVSLLGLVGLSVNLIKKNNKNKRALIGFFAYFLYAVIYIGLYLTYFWVRGFSYIYALPIVAAWPLLSILSFEGKEE